MADPTVKEVYDTMSVAQKNQISVMAAHLFAMSNDQAFVTMLILLQALKE